MLAGGSLRCASWAASTAPLWASATTQDSAETEGTPGTPAGRRTWVPGRCSGSGRGAAAREPSAAPGSAPPWAPAAFGASPSAPTAQSAQVAAKTREENVTII